MPLLGSKKSRKGCQKCKTRRVKCDEKIPCGNCIRRNETCSLSLRSSIARTQQQRQTQQEESLDTSLPATQTAWLLDIQLYNHFITSTVHCTFSDHERIRSVWRDVIPGYSLAHPFLLHALLSLGALHLAYLHRDSGPDLIQRYLRCYDKHTLPAMSELRSRLEDEVTADNAIVTFALSSVLGTASAVRSLVMAFARPWERAERRQSRRGTLSAPAPAPDSTFKGHTHASHLSPSPPEPDANSNITRPGLDRTSSHTPSTHTSTLSYSVGTLNSGFSNASSLSAVTQHELYVDIQDVVQLFGLAGGVREVVRTARPFVASSPLGDLLTGHTIPENHRGAVRLPPDVEARLVALETMVSSAASTATSAVDMTSDRDTIAVEDTTEAAAQTQCLLAAIDDLRDIYKTLQYYSQLDPPPHTPSPSILGTAPRPGPTPGTHQKGNIELGHSGRWLVSVPAEYVGLVQAHHGLALVILGYFAASTAAVDWAWQFRDWGRYCLRGISRELVDQDLVSWLDWPWEQVECGFGAVTGKVKGM